MTSVTVYLDRAYEARITHYRAAQASPGVCRGDRALMGVPDPEELEFTVHAPCGCEIHLTDDEAADVERQIQDEREAWIKSGRYA